jgi:hypothetical protein
VNRCGGDLSAVKAEACPDVATMVEKAVFRYRRAVVASSRPPHIEGIPVRNESYTVGGCRCVGCTEAHRVAHREYRARARRKIPVKRLHKRWSAEEKAIAMNPQLTTREAAEKVGRTLSAVAEMRRRSAAEYKKRHQDMQGEEALS